jgi:hypothetical protein
VRHVAELLASAYEKEEKAGKDRHGPSTQMNREMATGWGKAAR